VSGFELKFFSYVRLADLIVPRMKKAGGGVVVNVVGNAGRIPMDWHMPGGAANAALLNFTKALANQVGQHGIRVLAINPGLTDTDRGKKVIRFVMDRQDATEQEVRETVLSGVPLGRLPTVEDVGNAVAFLASDKASSITGTSLTIDGGVTAIL
jgi:NAD(P)-dependent dehydrogenase (short-subunit alcohol dehydrogenase family)